MKMTKEEMMEKAGSLCGKYNMCYCNRHIKAMRDGKRELDEMARAAGLRFVMTNAYEYENFLTDEALFGLAEA